MKKKWFGLLFACLIIYGYPRDFDASRDWSHKIKALYLKPHFEIVWDETEKTREESVGYQILSTDGTNVCVREVWLLKVPKDPA